jgi:NAD(P)-dependent dehydrogenase (short-subunit alcohol dehydrogenase family)
VALARRHRLPDSLKFQNNFGLVQLDFRTVGRRRPYEFALFDRGMWSRDSPIASQRRSRIRQKFIMVGWVVLITGGLTGIGRAAALTFAREGAIVTVAGRHEQAGAELVKQLRAFGPEAEFIMADVRHEDNIRAMVDKTVARFGRLDVAVNNAGSEGVPGPVTEQTPESYAATFDTNVLGVLLCMKHELRVMQSQGFGNIVNISSTMGSRGAPNASLYVASKHAVEGLTKSGALEAAAYGVRVNAVAPGPVETGMLDRFTGSPDRKAGLLASIPLRRAGKPEELADAILFLASDKASFVTGQIISVNGGRTAN